MVVAVFYGGKSCEHDVSVITGVQAAKLITHAKVVPVYIRRDGSWIIPKKFDDLGAYRGSAKGKRVTLRLGDPWLRTTRGNKIIRPDVALICNHGAGGEDGSLQGILESSGIAYTGSGIAASAIGLDKRLSKRMFRAANLDTLDAIEVTRADYESRLALVLESARRLGYPLIVKPASLGSSVGVKRVEDGKSLALALNLAFEWDNAAIVETALDDFIEYNCAVLGRGNRLAVSEAESPVSFGKLLTFSDKYGAGGFNSSGGARQFPAPVSPELRARIRAQAARAFTAIGASGIARVDFLYAPKSDRLYVNEINTIPGSLALYLFPDGVRYTTLTALENARENLAKNSAAPIPENLSSPTQPPTQFPTSSPDSQSPPSSPTQPPTQSPIKGAKYGEGSVEVINEIISLALAEKKERDSRRYRYDSPVFRGKQ